MTDEFPPIKIPREATLRYLYPAYSEDPDRALLNGSKPHGGTFGQSIAYLVLCEWCMSIWVSAGVVTGLWYWTPWLTHWVMAVMYGISAAAFTGAFASRVVKD